jgi:HK97 family phage portal protein
VKLFAQRSLSGQFWGTGDPDAFTRTEAAVKVSHDTALSDDAVLSAVSLLAGDIAGMPMKAYVTDGQLTQPIATQPSWLEAPDPQDMAMTAYSHKQQVALSILLAGNAYILCEPNIFNPIRLTVLNPIRVRVVKPSEERLFQVLGRTSPFEDWSPSDYETFSTANILHIPYLLRPGKLMGLSPIDAQTGNIGISLAMRKWVETFFGKGGQVSGFVVLPQDASETAVKEAERQVNTRWSGWRKAGIFGVLSGGANWMRTGLSPQDAALPDLWNRQLEMVARIYGIPPFMVGSQEPAGIAYASVESRKDEYVTHCLMRYTRPIEMAYSRLVPGDNRLTVRGSNTEVRFNYDALLRSDTKTRYELYGIALEHKFRTVDEVRAFENLKPMGLLAGRPRRTRRPPPDAEQQRPRGRTHHERGRSQSRAAGSSAGRTTRSCSAAAAPSDAALHRVQRGPDERACLRGRYRRRGDGRTQSHRGRHDRRRRRGPRAAGRRRNRQGRREHPTPGRERREDRDDCRTRRRSRPSRARRRPQAAGEAGDRPAQDHP